MTENILKCPLVYLASDEIQLKIQQGKSIFDFPCSEFPYLPRKKSWNSKKKKSFVVPLYLIFMHTLVSGRSYLLSKVQHNYVIISERCKEWSYIV